MKAETITFATIGNAIKHQWKTFLVILVLFSVIGVGSGAIFAGKLSSQKAGTAQPITPVALAMEKERSNPSYIAENKQKILGCVSETENYLQAVAQDKTLTVSQKEQLEACGKMLEEMKKTSLQQIETVINLSDVPLYSAEVIQREIVRCEQVKASISMSLIDAEEAAKLLSAMEAPKGGNENTDQVYTALLERAAACGTYKIQQIKNDRLLEQLKEKPDYIASKTMEAEKLLVSVAKELNALLETVNLTCGQIAADNHLNIITVKNGNELQTVVNHTYKETDPQEVFTIMTLFCVLLGAGAGLFFTVCKESKKEHLIQTAKTEDKAGDKA